MLSVAWPIQRFRTIYGVLMVTTEGGDITQTIPYILGLLAWGAVMYILAARTFRWE